MQSPRRRAKDRLAWRLLPAPGGQLLPRDPLRQVELDAFRQPDQGAGLAEVQCAASAPRWHARRQPQQPQPRRGFAARQSPITAHGGNAPAPRHLGLDRAGFGEGIVRSLAGVQRDQAAGVLVAEGIPHQNGHGRQLRPLRQQPVPQAGEDFVAERAGAGRRRHRSARSPAVPIRRDVNWLARPTGRRRIGTGSRPGRASADLVRTGRSSSSARRCPPSRGRPGREAPADVKAPVGPVLPRQAPGGRAPICTGRADRCLNDAPLERPGRTPAGVKRRVGVGETGTRFGKNAFSAGL